MPIEAGYSGGMSQPRRTTQTVSPAVSRQQVPSLISRSGARTSSPSYTPTSPQVSPSPTFRTTSYRAPSSPSVSTRTASTASRAPISRSSSSGGGSWSGGGGSWSGGGSSAPSNFSGGIGTSSVGTLSSFATPEPPPPPMWDELDAQAQEDYLAGDATFVAQRAALIQQLADQEASLESDIDNYGIDTEKTMRNLGWRGGKYDPKENKFGGGNWDPEDRIGAYGMAFGNQENDFAARGMLDSSGYDRAFGDMNTSFNRQRGDVMDALGTFLRNAEQRRGEFRNNKESDERRARADAIARRAASLGIGI